LPLLRRFPPLLGRAPPAARLDAHDQLGRGQARARVARVRTERTQPGLGLGAARRAVGDDGVRAHARARAALGHKPAARRAAAVRRGALRVRAGRLARDGLNGLEHDALHGHREQRCEPLPQLEPRARLGELGGAHRDLGAEVQLPEAPGRTRTGRVRSCRLHTAKRLRRRRRREVHAHRARLDPAAPEVRDAGQLAAARGPRRAASRGSVRVGGWVGTGRAAYSRRRGQRVALAVRVRRR
jgi:hypothetical protein